MGVARWFSRFVIFNCGRDIEYDLRKDLFAHLAGLDQVFYQRIKTGDLMSRMINDLSAVRMMVGMGVLSLTTVPVTFFFALAFMLRDQPAFDDRRDDSLRGAFFRHALAHAHADDAQPRRPGRTRRDRLEGAGKPLGHPRGQGLHASRSTRRSVFARRTRITTIRASRWPACAAP